MADLRRRLAAELVGTAFLVAAVIGSGIMAESLTGDPALALLANTLATGAILVVLITALGPVSGAHLNPVVTAVLVLDGDMPRREGLLYVPAQTAGAVLGTLAAHLMFDHPLLELATRARTGPAMWASETIASFGLVLVILVTIRVRPAATAALVGLYIVAAYWFTASTSFANPAVTIARALTDTFSGIRPEDVPAFIAAQLAGGLLALVFARWLVPATAR